MNEQFVQADFECISDTQKGSQKQRKLAMFVYVRARCVMYICVVHRVCLRFE